MKLTAYFSQASIYLSMIHIAAATHGTFFRNVGDALEHIGVNGETITAQYHHCSLSNNCSSIFQDVEKENPSTKDSSTTERPEKNDVREKWEKTEEGYSQNPVFTDCKDAYAKGFKESGPVQLSWGNESSFSTYCDMGTKGGGWTVIQRRINSTINFNRQWNEYVRGFGNVEGSFWLGLTAMHHLTKSGKITLRFDLKNKYGQIGYAEYHMAKIESESQKFAIKLGKFTGNIDDAMEHSNGMPFSSTDKDNDKSYKNCAEFYKGGWWNKDCFYANLNNKYPGHEETEISDAAHGLYADWMTWYVWGNGKAPEFGTIIWSEMKIRAAD